MQQDHIRDKVDVASPNQTTLPQVPLPAAPVYIENVVGMMDDPLAIPKGLEGHELFLNSLGHNMIQVPSSGIRSRRDLVYASAQELKNKWVLTRDGRFGFETWTKQPLQQVDDVHMKDHDDEAIPEQPCLLDAFNKESFVMAGLNKDPSWNFEQTHRLVELWRRFNGSFALIIDAFNDGTQFKPMEELKHRFATIVNGLATQQGRPGINLTYNPELDRARRTQLKSLEQRTPEQLKEEILLTDLMRDMVTKLPTQIAIREQVLRTLAKDYTLRTIPDIILGMPEKQHLQQQVKKKKPVAKRTSATKKPISRTVNEETTFVVNKKVQEEVPTIVPTKNGSSTIRVCLRSSMIKPVKASLIKHVDRILGELGIPLKLPICTAKTVDRFNALRDAITNVLEEKRRQGVTPGHVHSESTSHASSTGHVSLSNASITAIKPSSQSSSSTSLSLSGPAELHQNAPLSEISVPQSPLNTETTTTMPTSVVPGKRTSSRRFVINNNPVVALNSSTNDSPANKRPRRR